MTGKQTESGCYRDLEELIVLLAEFYLSTNLCQILTLTETNTFHIALGGDRAPFGKDNSICAGLVSVLNIGQGVLSRPVKRFLQDSYLILCQLNDSYRNC